MIQASDACAMPVAPSLRVHDMVWHWADQIPEAPVLLVSGRVIFYSALRAAIVEIGGFLETQGVQPGDRVLIVAENDTTAPLLMLAAQWMGAWPCIVNARIAAAEMEVLRKVVEPRLVIFAESPSREAQAFAHQTGAGQMDVPVAGNLAVAAFPGVTAEPVHDASDQRTALVLFTSGTTGLPKAVMLSHAALLGIGATLAQVRQVRQGGRYDGGAPLSHVMGVCTLMSVLHGGASLALTGRVDVPELAQRIAAGAVTHLSFVPTVYARLLDHIRQTGLDMTGARLEYISSGGAPLDPALKAATEAMFGVRLVNGYGMTECSPVARTHPGRDFAPESIGYPEPGASIRIVRPDGGAADHGEVGEMWARAVGQMQGYYRNPVASAEALRDGGWIATGDLATRAPDGEIRIVGRRKEMIIRSGFNVYPAEVEAALGSHPAILQSAVVGVKQPDGDEEVVAFVQLRPAASATPDELRSHVRSILAPYKCPARIFLHDALPLGSTGKILKRQLLDMLPAR